VVAGEYIQHYCGKDQLSSGANFVPSSRSSSTQQSAGATAAVAKRSSDTKDAWDQPATGSKGPMFLKWLPMWFWWLLGGLCVFLSSFAFAIRCIRMSESSKMKKPERRGRALNGRSYEPTSEATIATKTPPVQGNAAAEQRPLLDGASETMWQMPPTPTGQRIQTQPQLSTQPQLQLPVAMATQYPGFSAAPDLRPRSYVPPPGTQLPRH
jgi:hypothetical protein